jgi:phosphatidylglycerol:prolipoprotein diacylglycerol transferase
MIPYPEIDPVLVHIGPLAVRWYSLAYIAGFLLGVQAMKYANRRLHLVRREEGLIDDVLLYAVPAVILGGRLGYVLFYNFGYYAENPVEALKIWNGGMSFHGGLLGLAAGLWLYCRRREVPLLAFAGLASMAAPIGLFFGRIANFVNGELYGRETSSPLGMVFPYGGPSPRHPSQLYEAALEGLLLGVVLWGAAFWMKKRTGAADGGALAGLFFLGYAAARTFAERFREPDAHLGILFDALTMGQALSLPMALIGGWLVFRYVKARSRPNVS